jgi:hypothetical protein
MRRPDWRDPAAYADLTGAPAPVFAAAFLARNSDFHHDEQQLRALAAAGRMTDAQQQRFELQWGVRFRGGACAPTDPADARHNSRSALDRRRMARVRPVAQPRKRG